MIWPEEWPKTILWSFRSEENARYSNGSHRIRSVSRMIQCSVTDMVETRLGWDDRTFVLSSWEILPLGENATESTEPEWPSSVRCRLPVAASHSSIVFSQEPDASCLPSGENATEVIEPKWPSNVWSKALQSSRILDRRWKDLGIQLLNFSRVILFPGANNKADE